MDRLLTWLQPFQAEEPPANPGRFILPRYAAPVQPYNENIVTFKMMLRGFDEALKRLLQACERRDPSGAFPPLFESLNWAVALDDRIGTLLGKKWQDRVPEAAVMSGVRFARNRVHHQWADALLLVDGIPFPIPFPIPFFGWQWRPADKLPSGRNSRNTKGEDVYREHLQGDPAHYALVKLQAAFRRVGERLEPPRPNSLASEGSGA